MADTGKAARSPARSSARAQAHRSQRSIANNHGHGNTALRDDARTEIYEDSDESDDDEQPTALPRSHTPGHLASKSINDRIRKASTSELSIRQRAQSASHVSSRPSTAGGKNSKPPPAPSESAEQHEAEKDQKRSFSRSTSVLTSKSSTPAPRNVSGGAAQPPKGEHTAFPPMQDPKDAPDIAPAPASGMYWSKAPVSGAPHSNLRAHTTTLIGSNVYIFGGCDARACFNTMYVLDADAFYWSVPYVVGDIPMPLRAMTCTAVGKKLVIFGGGDGPAYYNDVYVLDTNNFRWTKPRIVGEKIPSKRRAHTACLYKNGIYVFGGGDGVRALNDIWRLDVSDMSKMSWKLISGPEKPGQVGKEHRPKARGYHTANMVGSKLIIYGGSDGGECFDDVWVYDVETHIWKAVNIPVTFRRLSHTATIVGSYLFVIGGHDGSEYCNDVLLLNLVTMTWDKRRVYGQIPAGRGYHGTVLHDSRLLVIGGFDGTEVFGDVNMLELAVHAYYSQISHFTIEV